MTVTDGGNTAGPSSPTGRDAGSSRPVSGIPRRRERQGGDDDAAPVGTPVEGKARFAAAAKSAAGATQSRSARPAAKSGGEKIKNLAKSAVGTAASFAGAPSGGGVAGLATKAKSLVGGKKKAADAAKNTSDLKKVGSDAAKNANKAAGLQGGDPNKAGATARAGKAIKTLGKERCKICGYQNGLNKAGICKKCVKGNRSNPEDVSAAEKAKNAATDLAAKAGAKALGATVSGVTFGAIPAPVVEKLTEGFIGKGLAAGSKVAKWQLIAIGGAVAMFFLMVAFALFSVLGGSGPGNIQGEAEVGALAENAAEVPPEQLDTYLAVSSQYQLPWSILAGIGEVTTKQGTVSPYDSEPRSSNFPFVAPAIVGETGRGPMLFTGEGLSDGMVTGTAPGGGRVLDPDAADVKFERRPGRVSPGGELLPGTAAAQDFIEKAFPNSPVTSDWRPPDPPYNYHNRGEALDVGCKGTCTASDVQRLHVVAAWFAQNPDVFGLDYIIWEQRENSGRGWTVMPDRGSPTANHYDHIHLNFKNPGTTSLGEPGQAWAGSFLSNVAANTASNPYSKVANDEDNNGEPTVAPDDGKEQEDTPTTDNQESRQDFVREVDALAQLVVEARDTVYRESEDYYKSKQLDVVALSQNPFKDDIHIDFWQKVIERLPIDFANTTVAKDGGGGGGTGSNVVLGDDVEAVISQLIWAKRWIESSNTYTLVNSYGYAGAYQYGKKEWNNYGGYPTADLAPKEVQDRRMTEDYRARLQTYGNDVKKSVQHHLCPAYVGQDTIICEIAAGLSSVQVNPDMGTYWACAAVLLNALPGNENKYSYQFTSAPGGVENYERNCKGRIPTALQDPSLPDSARGGAQVGGAEAQLVAAIDTNNAPVSGKPQETVFALSALQKAGEYSGLELKLIDVAPTPGEGGGPAEIIDGNPSAQGFIWPTTGPVTSGFGIRWGTPHRGIDIAPPRNTPVVASKAGQVVFAYNGCGEGSIDSFCGAPPLGGYGNAVLVKHEGDFYTLYAHLEPNSVKVNIGDIVQRGQVLGGVGSSGNSSGPHLHFEIRTNYTGGQVNPIPYLP